MKPLKTLQDQDLTLYVEKDGVVTFSSDRQGLRPLLRGVTKFGSAFRGAIVADKVVGLAAAYLLVRGKVKEVHTLLASKPGIETLEHHGIKISANKTIDDLIDPETKERCSMETLAETAGGVSLFINALQRQLKN